MPRKIVFLDEISKGPTGKLQRIGLADKLGLTSEQPTTQASLDKSAARTPIEEFLVEIWGDVLGLHNIGIHNRFLDLGGDSMLATQLVARVSQALQFEVSLIKFFEAPTIADQAVVLEGMLTLEIEELSEKSTRNLAT